MRLSGLPNAGEMTVNNATGTSGRFIEWSEVIAGEDCRRVRSHTSALNLAMIRHTNRSRFPLSSFNFSRFSALLRDFSSWAAQMHT